MPPTARKSAAVAPSHPSRARDRLSAKAPKKSQRERLLDAMTELAAQSGYQQVSVAQISSRAGVSSATFYTQFEDKEDCLLSAYQAARKQIVGSFRLERGGGAESVESALTTLLGAVQSHPAAGRVLLVESRAGGTRMRKQHERALLAFEQRIEDALAAPSGADRTLDVPAAALVGGVRRVAVWRLRSHAQDELPLLVADLLLWMESYGAPAAGGRWSVGETATLPRNPSSHAVPVPTPADRLPRGRHGLPAGVVARSQHTRIIYGTAQVMVEKGFAAATVADIVAAAGVSREVFYEHFDDKLHAFLEAQRYSTQEIHDACATAYFSAVKWPERVWRALRTLVTLVASHPSLAYLRLVECYAAGPAAISRAEDVTRSFTVFLEEGFGYRAEAAELPRVCLQAIAGSIFELMYRQIVSGEVAALGEQLPRLVYIALAPFAGPEEAIRLVKELSARNQGSRRGNADAARTGAGRRRQT